MEDSSPARPLQLESQMITYTHIRTRTKHRVIDLEPKLMVFRVWTQDQWRQHYLGSRQKYKAFGPLPRSTESETVEVGPSVLWFNSLPGDSDAHSNMSTITDRQM